MAGNRKSKAAPSKHASKETAAKAPQADAPEIVVDHREPLENLKERVEVCKRISTTLAAGEYPSPDDLYELRLAVGTAQLGLLRYDSLTRAEQDLTEGLSREANGALESLAGKLDLDPEALWSAARRGESWHWKRLGQVTARAEEVKPPEEPLTGRAEEVYQHIIKSGPLTGKEITGLTGIDQSTLTSIVIPELKRLRGVKNKRGAGYYSPQHYRQQ